MNNNIYPALAQTSEYRCVNLPSPQDDDAFVAQPIQLYTPKEISTYVEADRLYIAGTLEDGSHVQLGKSIGVYDLWSFSGLIVYLFSFFGFETYIELSVKEGAYNKTFFVNGNSLHKHRLSLGLTPKDEQVQVMDYASTPIRLENRNSVFTNLNESQQIKMISKLFGAIQEDKRDEVKHLVNLGIPTDQEHLLARTYGSSHYSLNERVNCYETIQYCNATPYSLAVASGNQAIAHFLKNKANHPSNHLQDRLAMSPIKEDSSSLYNKAQYERTEYEIIESHDGSFTHKLKS